MFGNYQNIFAGITNQGTWTVTTPIVTSVKSASVLVYNK